jgi:hypothetical protein
MSLEALIAADDLQQRMKKGEAAIKARMERHGYNFKRNVANPCAQEQNADTFRKLASRSLAKCRATIRRTKAARATGASAW